MIRYIQFKRRYWVTDTYIIRANQVITGFHEVVVDRVDGGQTAAECQAYF